MIAPLDETITAIAADQADADEQAVADALQAARLERHADAVTTLWRDLQSIAAEVFAPRERLSPLQWGERHYELPESSAVRGLFDAARMPYLRGVFESLHDPRARRVVVAKGSQLAFTTVGQIWAGWMMHQSPAAMLSIWPTEGLLKRYVLTRINPMLEQVSPLKAIFGRSGLRESDDSIKHKGGPGFTLDFISAKSTNELRSISAERIHVSEVDELDEDLGDQGDPLELARRALRTYQHTAKEYLECTPTIHGRSRVWRELAISSWNEREVPCPHCGAMQVMRWTDLPADDEAAASSTLYDASRDVVRHFTYDLDSYGHVVPGSTHYVCVQCACLIPQSRLSEMDAAGRWVPRYPERTSVIGFHLPAWYSPIQSWDICARLYEDGRRSPAVQKVFVNTVAGLPYKETFTQPEAHFLQARAEVYRAPVPEGVIVLTAGADLGKDSVELCVWGWGAGEESWLIAWERLEGDPASPEMWQQVGEVLSRAYLDGHGDPHFVKVAAIDAGFQGTKVKAFCNAWRGPLGGRAIHVIGRDGRTRPIIEQPGADTKKRRRSKRPSWVVGDEAVKDLLYSRFRVSSPGPEFVHTPVGTDKAFYLQLTAEQLRTITVGGRPVRKWILPDERRNEALDCTKYAVAALHSLGAKVIQQLAKLALLPPEQRAPSRRRRARLTSPPPESSAGRPPGDRPELSRAGAPRGRPKRRGMISKGVE